MRSLDEPCQPPLPRPCYGLSIDPTVRIAPDRPAPPYRDAQGCPLPFVDDLAAIGDHGSTERLPSREAALTARASTAALLLLA
jgi:hypothetical protein